MSEFLLVVPEGWVELDDPELVITNTGIDWLNGVVANKTWYEIDQTFEQIGLNRPGFIVGDFRLINAGAGYRIWVMFVPEA